MDAFRRRNRLTRNKRDAKTRSYPIHKRMHEKRHNERTMRAEGIKIMKNHISHLYMYKWKSCKVLPIEECVC